MSETPTPQKVLVVDGMSLTQRITAILGKMPDVEKHPVFEAKDAPYPALPPGLDALFGVPKMNRAMRRQHRARIR